MVPGKKKNNDDKSIPNWNWHAWSILTFDIVDFLKRVKFWKKAIFEDQGLSVHIQHEECIYAVPSSC